jgi:hypothetical protein
LLSLTTYSHISASIASGSPQQSIRSSTEAAGAFFLVILWCAVVIYNSVLANIDYVQKYTGVLFGGLECIIAEHNTTQQAWLLKKARSNFWRTQIEPEHE